MNRDIKEEKEVYFHVEFRVLLLYIMQFLHIIFLFELI